MFIERIRKEQKKIFFSSLSIHIKFHSFTSSSSNSFIIFFSLLFTPVLREEFKTLPKSQAIVSGDRVTLDCVPPRGYPEPKVYWAKDGRPVSLPSNRIKLIPGGSLRINDVRPHDAGRYTCIAENLIGTKESPPAILEVSGKYDKRI